MNAARVLRSICLVVLVLGGFMATSLVWVLVEPGMPGLVPWLTSVLLTLGLGTLGTLVSRDKRPTVSARAVTRGGELTRREAMVIVTGSWVACSAFSALPLMLDGMAPRPVDALFEAASGFTTTGSSILADIEANSRASLWWRSMIQWLGGMGIVVLFVAIFPQVGGSGRKLFESESPGPTNEQLRPRIRQTGLMLWRIYVGFTVALAGLLAVEGMTGFEAVCHAFTTMATGGFSTRNTSIAAFDSVAIEMTITAFMLLAGVNFALYFRLSQGAGRAVLKDGELAVYAALFVGLTAVVALTTTSLHEGDLVQALRYASFEVAATITTTGFATDDFDVYPHVARALLLLGMFVGGMGGSTAGGFKISRAIIISKAALAEVRRAVHPRAVYATRMGGKQVPEHVLRAAMGMFVITIVLLVATTVALAAMGLDEETAFSAAMTCLFNNGPGLNALGPTQNFAALPDLGKLLLATLMIVGRLEFYTALALLLPGFWKPGGPV